MLFADFLLTLELKRRILCVGMNYIPFKNTLLDQV